MTGYWFNFRDGQLLFSFLEALFSLAHQVGSASEVDGLATVQGAETGNGGRSLWTTVGNKQLNHFG